jgi:uncharacterized protein YyaL (SSP411 family)
MTDAETGGFHSSLDADSEGEEGRFYVWSHTEIMQLLGPEDGRALLRHAYQIKPGGNFHEEASGRPTGLNIPHLADLRWTGTTTRPWPTHAGSCAWPAINASGRDATTRSSRVGTDL